MFHLACEAVIGLELIDMFPHGCSVLRNPIRVQVCFLLWDDEQLKMTDWNPLIPTAVHEYEGLQREHERATMEVSVV